MSKVKIEGNASGTGTLTIAAPNTNIDRTLTLPDGAGELLTTTGDGSQLTNLPSPSGPIFRAYRTTDQTLAHNTETKIAFDTVDIDTDSCYDEITNYRFTPTTAGYYLLSLFYQLNPSSYIDFTHTGRIRKNGSEILRAMASESNAPSIVDVRGSLIVEANGTTDYFEAYGYHYDYTNSTSITLKGDTIPMRCAFEAVFLRGL
jgi:hypothetical protein